MRAIHQTILFAVDDDDALPPAIPTVVAYALAGWARVCVLHIQRDGADRPAGPRRRLVTAVVEQLWSCGVDACGEVRVVRRGDDVADVLARAAKAAEADMVAIEVDGCAGLGAAFLGSVSLRVATGLEVPVLVLTGMDDGVRGPDRVLVAVDGSAMSAFALADAAAVARAFGSRVRVLHVRPEPRARQVVDSALAFLRAREVEATGEWVAQEGVPAAIVAAAERFGAGLVVLGGGRAAELGGLRLGAVAHRAVHLLRRPVLLAGCCERPARRRGPVRAQVAAGAVMLLPRA